MPMSSLHRTQFCPVLAPGDLKLLGKRKLVISVGIYKLWEAGADVSPGPVVPLEQACNQFLTCCRAAQESCK